MGSCDIKGVVVFTVSGVAVLSGLSSPEIMLSGTITEVEFER